MCSLLFLTQFHRHAYLRLNTIKATISVALHPCFMGFPCTIAACCCRLVTDFLLWLNLWCKLWHTRLFHTFDTWPVGSWFWRLHLYICPTEQHTLRWPSLSRPLGRGPSGAMHGQHVWGCCIPCVHKIRTMQWCLQHDIATPYCTRTNQGLRLRIPCGSCQLNKNLMTSSISTRRSSFFRR